MNEIKKPIIGLVVLNFNDYCTTLQFLDVVQRNKLINLTVVVDNHSTDDSLKYLQERECEKIKVVSTEINRGYASGNNFGIKVLEESIKPDYIIVANPDVIFDEEYITEMLQCFGSQKNAAAAAGVMKAPAIIKHPKVAWKLPNYFDLLLSNFLALQRLTGDRTFYKNDYLMSNRFVKVDVIPGSLVFLNREAMDAIQGYDESTFLYEEENILSYKLKQSGYNTYLASSVSYFHNHGVSVSKSIPQVGKRMDIDYESRMIYATKYLKIGVFKRFLLRIAFKIGKFDYLLYLRLAKK